MRFMPDAKVFGQRIEVCPGPKRAHYPACTLVRIKLDT